MENIVQNFLLTQIIKVKEFPAGTEVTKMGFIYQKNSYYNRWKSRIKYLNFNKYLRNVLVNK